MVCSVTVMTSRCKLRVSIRNNVNADRVDTEEFYLQASCKPCRAKVKIETTRTNASFLFVD